MIADSLDVNHRPDFHEVRRSTPVKPQRGAVNMTVMKVVSAMKELWGWG